MVQNALEVKFAMKYRVKFTKGEEIKYIGHLDVMRLFQRAINRAMLPVAYSKGFNPHQQLAFANPLSLGMTSTAEYGDFEMTKEISESELVNKLNAQMPDGMNVLEAVRLAENAGKAMADVEAASYIAMLDERVTNEMLEKALPEFLSQKEILVMKKTKHNFKETDIRGDIFAMENKTKSGNCRLFLFLAAGSERSVKAELVVNSFYDFIHLEFDRFKIRYERTELFRKENGSFMPLNCGVSESLENGVEA